MKKIATLLATACAVAGSWSCDSDEPKPTDGGKSPEEPSTFVFSVGNIWVDGFCWLEAEVLESTEGMPAESYEVFTHIGDMELSEPIAIARDSRTYYYLVTEYNHDRKYLRVMNRLWGTTEMLVRSKPEAPGATTYDDYLGVYGYCYDLKQEIQMYSERSRMQDMEFRIGGYERTNGQVVGTFSESYPIDNMVCIPLEIEVAGRTGTHYHMASIYVGDETVILDGVGVIGGGHLVPYLRDTEEAATRFITIGIELPDCEEWIDLYH